MTTTTPVCTDPVILNQWHAISALDEIATGVVNETLLLDEAISFTVSPDGELVVWRSIAELSRCKWARCAPGAPVSCADWKPANGW